MNKTGRRSIWGANQPAPTPATEAIQEFNGTPTAAPPESVPAAVPVVDQLRVADKTRRRDWEEQHKSRAFRGVAPNVHAAVRAVAENEQHTIDEMAQALLDFSLLCYQRGEIELQPVLDNQRRTLFPGVEGRSARPGKKAKVQWTEKTWGLKPPKKRTAKVKKGVDVRPWKDWPVVAYRLSDELFRAIERIGVDQEIQRGELVSKLLMHALDAYEAGRLVIVSETGEEA